jgi:hypothetical protein
MAQTKGTKAGQEKPKKPSAKKAPAKKASAKKASAKKSPAKKGKGGAKRKAGGAKQAVKRPAGKGGKAGNGASASGNGGAAAKASSNGSDGGSAVGAAVEKAKLPLLATGAVVAGAAAVIATKGVANHKQHKVLGVPVPKRPKAHLPKVSVPKVSAPKVNLPKGKDLKGDVRRAAGAVADAAGKADAIGKRISQVASSVQAVGSTADDTAKKS